MTGHASCGCCNNGAKRPVLSFVAHSRVDPTNTTTIRRKYVSEMVRRFRVVRRLVVSRVQSGSLTFATNAPLAAAPARHQEFMDWLREQINSNILEVSKTASSAPQRRSPWQDLYIRASYRRGMDGAAKAMRSGGVDVAPSWVDAAFRRPFHADRVALAYVKAYSELEGVTTAMEKRISSSLATSMAQGWGAKETAKALAKAVDGIGITRAKLIARTETISAHAEATLNSYEDAGLAGVNVLSEFTNARDNRVCPRCDELGGTTYTISEARGIIPVHPNCRCSWTPYIGDDDKGKRLN